MEMVTPSEAIELLSSMYLCKPSREAIENWRGALDADSSVFLADLKKAINDIDTVAEKEMEDLMWDYTRLFIGPYKLPCPPWESVYTSPKKLMMQDAADKAMRLYEEAGLAINTADIMPDHIGAELNFLAVLLQRMQSGKDGNERYTRITEKLLNDHLLKWMPEFTRDMEDAAESSFYKALARTTRDVVDFAGR
jgi:putative dimethyl sulfoxide reductase chaperone